MGFSLTKKVLLISLLDDEQYMETEPSKSQLDSLWFFLIGRLTRDPPQITKPGEYQDRSRTIQTVA